MQMTSKPGKNRRRRNVQRSSCNGHSRIRYYAPRWATGFPVVPFVIRLYLALEKQFTGRQLPVEPHRAHNYPIIERAKHGVAEPKRKHQWDGATRVFQHPGVIGNTIAFGLRLAQIGTVAWGVDLAL